MRKNSLFPEFVRKAAITAPAGPVSKAAIENALKILKSFGMKAWVAPGVFQGGAEKYFSAPAEVRGRDFNLCLEDEKADIILCARGGYGCASMLRHINWDLLKARALPVLGYSDITILHCAMTVKNAGIPVAAPSASFLGKALEDSYTGMTMRAALERLTGRGKQPFEFPLPQKCRLTVIKGVSKTVTGPVLPVNLTSLVSIAGTPWFPDLSGRMLLIEDICEPPRKIHRCLTQLELSGQLRKCACLIFAHFTKCGFPKEKKLVYEAFAGALDGPVIAGFPFGHTTPTASLIYGEPLSVDSSGTVSLWR